MKHKHLLSTLVLLVLGILPGWSQVPQLVNFQGRVAVDGTNFDGLGLFKFAIVNATGTRTYWSHDRTSVNGSEPAEALKLDVRNGLYSVLLGDANLRGMDVLPADVFTIEELYLRVWFDDGSNGSQLLSPDQRIAAVGYALMAANVPNGIITSNKLANNAVTSAKLADNSVGPDALGPDSVGSSELQDAAVDLANLAPNAVDSARVADGSLLGIDLETDTVTGTQLADVIELGSATADGTLLAWDNGNDEQTVRLLGGSAEITTYGSDGLRQTRLWGLSWGELELYDDAAENNRTVLLSTTEIFNPGGVLDLSNATDVNARLKAASSGGTLQLSHGGSEKVTLRSASAGGGQLTLNSDDDERTFSFTGGAAGSGTVYQADDMPSIFLNGSGNSITLYQNDDDSGVFIDGESVGAGYISVRNNLGQTRVGIDGESTGTGGEVRVHDADGTETVELLGAETETKGGRIRVRDETGTTFFQVNHDSTEGGGEMWLYDEAGNVKVFLEAKEGPNDGAELALYNAAGEKALRLDAEFNDGGPSRVTTGTVEITGGSDLSEQFEISGTDCIENPEPGMIVCIDPKNPGQLIPSSRSYDRTVAGIISGAGGVRPGLLMGQQGSVANGAHPVALTGRVYCMMDASQGAIEPGDLITTSDTPGHGMTVTDHDKARGAIIGKAMTRLEEGTGLVLVLVSLQ